MSKLIIINGVAEAGKDTFVNFIDMLSKNGIRKISTIDQVKRFCEKYMGVEIEPKTDKKRKLWNDMRIAMTAYDDRIFRYVAAEISAIWTHSPEKIITVMCREPEEIQKYKNKFKEKCEAVLIVNEKKQENIPNNEADQGVFNYKYDWHIYNNSTLGEFLDDAQAFCNKNNLL